MTRRPPPTADRAVLLASAAPSSTVAAALDISPARVRQLRRATGQPARPTGRPPVPTSQRALAALGQRVVVLAEAASVPPDALIRAGFEALTTREQRAALIEED